MRRAFQWLMLWIFVRGGQKMTASLQRPAAGIFHYPGRPIYSVLCVIELLALLAALIYLLLEGGAA